MSNFSKEQLSAIKTKDKNLTVSASAGSGKTFVLVNRILERCIEDKVSFDNILSLTFTDNAASEMKSRLNVELNKLIEQDQNNEYLLNQRSILQNANISSFHSFFYSIVKEYGFTIGLSLERVNTIVDQATLQLYKEEAFESCKNYFINKDLNKFILISDNFDYKNNSYERFKNCIMHLVDKSLNYEDSKKYFETIRTLNSSYIENDKVTKNFMNLYIPYLQFHINSMNELIDLLVEETTNNDFLDKADSLKNHLFNINKLIETNSYQDIQRYINRLELTLKKPRGTDDSFKKPLEDLKDLFKSLQLNVKEEAILVNDLKINNEILDYLIDFSLKYIELLNNTKDEHNCIDFSDMELYAYQILTSNNGEIAKLLQEKFIDILIDEYQDTNQLQENIIRLISRDNNVFRVGDIKQSIYGFRGSNPKLMINQLNSNNPNDENIFLYHNYRSNKNIIEFNNSLYNSIMNTEGVNTKFDEYDFAHVGTTKQETDNKHILFELINKEKLEEEEFYFHLVNTINNLLVEGNDYKDITILMRNSTKFSTIKKYLDKYNIPNFVPSDKIFFSTKSVSTILSILRYLDNPYNDIALYSIALSPILDLHETDLIKLKFDNIKLVDYLKNNEIFNIIENLRRDKDNLSLVELLSYIINLNNYYQSYCDIEDKVNIDCLLETIANFSNNNKSLKDFLNVVDNLVDSKVEQATPFSLKDNLVKISTIHKSKGLQYKNVIILDDNSMTNQDIKNSVLIYDNIGFVTKIYNSKFHVKRGNLLENIIKHQLILDAFEENSRLYYVATTRAVSTLTILTYNKVDSIKTQSYNYSNIYKPGFISWIKKYSTGIESYIINNVIEPPYIENKVGENIPLINNIDNFKEAYSPSSLHTIKYNDSLFTKTGTSYGTQMHRICELLPKVKMSKEEIIKFIDTLNIDRNLYNLDNILELYNNEFYLESFNYENFSELSFYTKIDNSLVNGYIDYMFIKNNEIHIIDYKTDNLSEKELLLHYSSQLEAYITAMESIKKMKSYAYIYSFKLNKLISIKK